MAADALVTAVNVKFVVKPDKRDGFLKNLRQDADQTMATEAGNLQFVVGEDVSTANTFHLHEQYQTEADYESHRATPHFQTFVSFLADDDPLAEPPVVAAYECQHEARKIPPRRRPAFCLNVESRVKPEFREEFAALMERHRTCSLAEPLCMQFDYGISLDDPNAFHQHEQFTGDREGLEGYEAHQAGAHFDRFMEFNKKEPYTKSQGVYLFKTIFLD